MKLQNRKFSLIRLIFAATLAALCTALFPALTLHSFAWAAEETAVQAETANGQAEAEAESTPDSAAQQISDLGLEADSDGEADSEPDAAAQDSADKTAAWDAEQSVTLETAEGTIELSLDDYLTGVLLAEVPAGFSLEALKAQAVAARTFTLRQQQAEKHTGGALCEDSACCQAYFPPEQAAEKLGEATEDLLGRLRQAVAETDGEVLLYEGTLIDATYFSCSGGRTEDALAVWGTDVAYLQAVDSPGEESSPRYTESQDYTLAEFREILEPYGCALDDAPAAWIGEVTYTDGGGVETVNIGGVVFTGTQLRQLLGLRSTKMEIAIMQEGVSVTTWGNGHRVGLSQYGAEAMAEAGSDYEEILTHYYTGVSLQRYTG